MVSIAGNKRDSAVFMIVYVEYAFLENTLFDFALLCMAALLCNVKITWWKTLLSAGLGGVFAVLFPLLALPNFLLLFLKIAVGFLLCLAAFPRLKTKKDGGRYALNVALFFILTFLYGGALTALFSNLFHGKIPVFIVVTGFAFFSLLLLLLARKFREKRAVYRHIYDCAILYKQRVTAVLGYMDSGNLASKNGVPVCFLSADVFYDIWGEELAFATLSKNGEDVGQVCDEMQISTMSGEKRIKLFLAVIEICLPSGEKVQKQVYFSPSANMINREYKLLLNAAVIRD